MTRRLKLSRQIAIAIVTVGIVELLLVGGVVLTYLYFLNQNWLASLDKPTRDAMLLMRAGGMPAPEMIVRAVRADQALNATGAVDVLPMLGWLSLLALFFCVATGTGLGWWLSRPLSSVATAAREVTSGQLSARARPSRFASADTARLVDDFNAMAERLERSDRQVREATAAIAHELRTPLTVLKGRLHGLADGVFKLEPVEIQALLKQVEGLGRIVDDLRTVSMADAGRLELQVAPIDLAQEAQLVVEACRAPFAAEGVALETDLQPARVVGDADRLRQALLAALENGRRHAAAGRALRIETATLNGQAVLRVLDRGPGLSREALEQVFSRFWRGDPSRSRRTGGSGLGLSVIRAIASAHGGEASLTNREGGGASLQILIPLSGKEA